MTPPVTPNPDPASSLPQQEKRWTLEKPEYAIGSWLVDGRGNRIAYSQFDATQKAIADAHNATLSEPKPEEQDGAIRSLHCVHGNVMDICDKCSGIPAAHKANTQKTLPKCPYCSGKGCPFCRVKGVKEALADNAQAVLQKTSPDWALYFKIQRESLGLTQLQMARLLECGEKSYCRWENGAEPTAIVVKLLQSVIALKKIMRFSYGGCQVGCLNCGEVNELASHVFVAPSVVACVGEHAMEKRE